MSRHTLASCLVTAAVAVSAHAFQDAGARPAPAPADEQPSAVTLNVQQQPLGQVLEMISVQQHVNIVAGVDTTVPVTANFYDASLEQALDWVLSPLGFAWTFDGQVYEVMPATSYDLIQRPLVHRTFRPNYVSVAELEKFLTQFLSPQGRLVVSEAPTTGIPSGADEAGGLSSTLPETLIAIDNQQAIDKMVEMVRELDSRPRQVLVEATILEIKLDETNRFGVDLSILGDSQFEDFDSLFSPGNVYSEDGINPLTPEGTSSFNQLGFTENNGSGLRLGWVGSNVAIFLEALQTDTLWP